MAQAKIISFVDAEVQSALRGIGEEIEAARVQSVHDTASLILNIRHDIKVLNNLVRKLREDVDRLKQGGDTQAK